VIGRIDGDEKGDWLILSFDVAHHGESQQGITARHPERRISIRRDQRSNRPVSKYSRDGGHDLRRRRGGTLREKQREQYR
jgi:hypothetical protein